ncbi:aminotransferase, class V, putative [Talaromyces stipitatus ATCC 10500]|uniref:alanine--glyoxylate transaminase n=1 Tax=Talaromyces stipitatus (strain ATCC 10500 / CBS 375.48 / QM 6759 / NRRL 1006) TaxID=441959 RepID=B8LVE8_TALSN|nr:aminotransferase, class V, putative [Talaromyces stipitatus ATCC 10500]EED23967.1 aminotransferase, class V, putative [Talaromyces stipitatus ATCC 10500]
MNSEERNSKQVLYEYGVTRSPEPPEVNRSAVADYRISRGQRSPWPPTRPPAKLASHSGRGNGNGNSGSNPNARLSLIARHFDQRLPLPELNTPFSSERLSVEPDDLEYNPIQRTPPPPQIDSDILPPITQYDNDRKNKMSSQPAHSTLLIPGPIEFDDAVLQSMSHYAESHVGPAFVRTFGESLTLLRKLFQTTDPASQPFIISGSGTLGWDIVASNLIERGEEALVLHTGYFGDSFAAALETYGAKATQLKAPIGDRPSLAEIEEALKQKQYKLITITHVDTSTGVLSDIKAVSELVHRVSPDTLVVVDGVCSVGCEEIDFDAWGLDVVLTASQKAIGCPPGLSILMLSGRAINVFKTRKTPPASYYASIANWQPIMQNYEAGKPSYFATPPTQLVHALHTTLSSITSRPMSERFAIHAKTSDKVKAAVAALGLTQLATKPENQAHAMTAIRLPEGVTAPEILPGLLKRGVVFAGGLHKAIAPTYIRFGHMGVSVTDPNRKDIDNAIAALQETYAEVKKAKGL